MPPKIRDVLSMLHAEVWYLVQQRGSHRQLKHPDKPGRVTVAGKPSDDVSPGLLTSILRQAGHKR
jgi:predicted RNA binding protein YcfA (HicA-like mRNA interferase family)